MQNMPKLPPLCSPSSDRYSKYNNNLILPKSQPHQQILSPNSPQSILPQPFSVMHHLNHQSDLNEEPNMKKHMMNVHNQNQFIGVGSYGRKDWLAWSVVSLVIFFPLFIFWVPALICSITARNKFFVNDVKAGKLYAKFALGLNISCLVFACIGYLCAIIVPLSVAAKACEDNICFRYCNVVKEKYVCYEDYSSYVKQTNAVTYSNCKYSFYSGTYLCYVDYKFKKMN